MKTYLIPTTATYEYELYDHLYLIHANSSQEAYKKAKEQLDANIPQKLSKYECYDTKLLNIPNYPFHKSKMHDILYPILLNTKGFEHMAFFTVNWNNYTEQLSSIASTETWSNDTYPNKGMLANYIVNTYKKLQSERKIIFGQDYALFNTGLFTKYYEPIYTYQSGAEILFLTGYDLSSINIYDRPERANYFDKPELLLFDWHYPIDVKYKHILEDENNRKRLPKELLDSNNIVTILNGAIDTMKKKVSSNYKLAIPQYYDGKIQLLLPLCLCNDNKPDIAIAVTKKENCYQGSTCLTIDMAYNNARLIAKPENNWLSQ